MTLCDFLFTYGNGYGNHKITIIGYCEELTQEEIYKSYFYESIKLRTVFWWNTVCGYFYPVEVIIQLKK